MQSQRFRPWIFDPFNRLGNRIPVTQRGLALQRPRAWTCFKSRSLSW